MPPLPITLPPRPLGKSFVEQHREDQERLNHETRAILDEMAKPAPGTVVVAGMRVAPEKLSLTKWGATHGLPPKKIGEGKMGSAEDQWAGCPHCAAARAKRAASVARYRAKKRGEG